MATINMSIGAGVTNNSPIVDGVVKVLAGGKNNAPVIGTVILAGGTNTSKGTVTGGLVISAGGINTAPVTGNVLVTGGTNTGSVTGTVRVGAGGTQGGTITGTLILEAGATIRTGTVVSSGSTIVLPSGVTAATAMANIVSFTGTVTQPVTTNGVTTLQAITYATGTAGSASTVTGLFFNLEPSPNNNKAYDYTASGKTLFSGAVFNLTGDNKAWQWTNGVKASSPYSGPLNGVNYVNGVAEYVPPPADAFVEFIVQADTNTATPGKLYTATGGNVTVGPVYTTSGRTALYTGSYLYSDTTYYALVGTPQTYRSWSVTGARTAVFTNPAVTSLTAGLVYTTSGLSNAYTGTFTYNNEGYYSDAGTARKYRAWTVTVTGGTTTLYTAPAATSVLSSTTYNNTTLSSAYSGILIDNAVTYYVAAGTARTYRAWAVTNGASVLYTAPAGDVTVGPVNTDTTLATGYTGNFTYNGTAYTAAAGIVGSAGRAWTVTGGTTGGTLYTSATGTIPTDTVYTTAALNTPYTGVFTYSSSTYYAVAGVANLYRAWTVSNDNTDIVAGHTLYTVADGNVLTSSVYTDSARQSPYTGPYTSGGTTKYALNGTPQSYIGYAVTNDTNTANSGNLYSDPLFTGLAGTFLYTESSLTNKYTGYYTFEGDNFYALAGELVDYRPWTVTLAGSSATVYTDVIAALVTGSKIYTTSAKDTPYTTVVFYLGTSGEEGYTRVDTDISGDAIVVAQNHQYSSYGSYYHDNATLATEDIVYTGQYTDTTANDVSITLESDGVAGFGTFSTNGQGVATITLVNHAYNYDASTWWNSMTLATGDLVYSGQYTLFTANITTFYSGTENTSTYSYVTTDGNGIATVTAVNHANGSGTTWWDSDPLATGAVVYAGQYTNSVAGNAVFTIGTDGNSGFGNVSTDGGGIATVNMADHQYNDYANNGQSYSWDSNPLGSGATVYSSQYSFSLASNASFGIGMAGTVGYANVTTDANGIAAVTAVNHQYGSGTTWWDNETLATGDTVYLGQYTDAPAQNAQFNIGTEGQSGYKNVATAPTTGVATVTAAYNHPYGSGTTWWNSDPLTTGSTVYNAQDTMVSANNTAFTIGTEGEAGYAEVTTGEGGVATVTAVNHPNSTDTYYYNDITLVSGATVYSGRYTNDIAANAHFFLGTDGWLGYSDVYTDANGIASVTAVNHANNSSSYWWDGGLVDGVTIWNGQYTYGGASNAAFEVGSNGNEGYALVTTNSLGVADVTYIDHPQGSGTTWWDNTPLVTGATIYTGRYSTTKSGTTSFANGTDTVSVNGDGIATVSATANHGYGFGTTWWDVDPLATGATVYTAQNAYTVNSYNTFGIGTEGTAAFYNVTTDVNGVATVTAGPNHGYGAAGYWWDNETLVDGAIVYAGQYTNSIASSMTFSIGTDGTAGFATVTTTSLGGADVTVVDHANNSGNYWWDSLVVGALVYGGRYTMVTQISTSFSIGTEGTAGYTTVTTDMNGAIATITSINHSYGAGSTWWDNATLATGHIVYSGQHTNSVVAGLTVYAGTDGQAGYSSITTDSNGAVTSITAINHPYGSNSNWWDSDPLATGAIVYAGQYTNSVYVSASFTIGTDGSPSLYNVTTDVNGVATVTAVNHSYGMAGRNHDNATLAAGDTIYTGQYTNSVAANDAFYIGTENTSTYSYVTTDVNGVATVTAVNHASGSGTTWWDSATSLATGYTVYLGQYTTSVAADALFSIGTDGTVGFSNVTTDANGIATVTAVNHQYGSGTTWWDNETLATGDTVYSGQYTNSVTVGSFTIGTAGTQGYTEVTLDAGGVVTDVIVDPINHPNSTSGYYHDNSPLADGDTVYTGQYTDTVASTGTFTIGTAGTQGYTEGSIDSSGVVTLVVNPINHPYGSGTTWWDNETLATGDTVYSGQYVDTAAGNAEFTLADGSTVATTSAGVATVTPPTPPE